MRERRDSRGSNDRERDWDHVRSTDERGPVTPDRTRKRLSSFEDIKVNINTEIKYIPKMFKNMKIYKILALWFSL